MSKLQLCCIILIVVTINSESLASEEVTFKNVVVTTYDTKTNLYQEFHITSANNINEHESSQSFVIINNVEGSFTVLRKNSVTDLSRLDTFGMFYGNLERIESGAFKNLPNLRTIRFSSTPLKEVEEGVFNDLPIKSLSLTENAIKRVAPGAFDNMTNLEYINLSRNQFTRWNPNWFQNTPKLKFLDSTRHRIEELPRNAFQNLRNKSIIIILDHGPLRTLPDNLFGGVKEVRVLDLSHSQIETFGEDVFNGLERMESLDLARNEIRCFYGNFSRIFVAKTTYLGYNPVMQNEGCMKNISLWTQSSEGQGHEIADGAGDPD